MDFCRSPPRGRLGVAHAPDLILQTIAHGVGSCTHKNKRMLDPHMGHSNPTGPVQKACQVTVAIDPDTARVISPYFFIFSILETSHEP